ncbi:MAG TPA: amidase family protein, partial [Nitrososphaera sp.]|nr:amidase family protein [Nitrososphaera sp.]
MDKETSASGISRRSVLRSAAIGGAAGALFPALSAGRAEADSQPAAVKGFEFDEVTISDLQKRMSSGELSARSLVQSYLERIENVDSKNSKGPGLNSVIEVNPDALAIAEELDKEHKAKGPRGPLHGIPVL